MSIPRNIIRLALILLGCLALATSCLGQRARVPEAQRYTYSIIAQYPHDTNAYTQGLLIRNGRMYESTGLRGLSTLREVDLNTGRVKRQISLAPRLFAEGLAYQDGHFYQLTWQSRQCFVYDTDFRQTAVFQYPTDGWGLECDGRYLYQSDGTDNIYVRNIKDFSLVRTIRVKDHLGPVFRINEMELIDGLLYANIYQTDYIVAIDLKTGHVVKRIDLSGLLPRSKRTRHTDVLNGIAYDAQKKEIYITGKNWPLLFKVEFLPQ